MEKNANLTGKGWQPGQSGNPNGRPKSFGTLTKTLAKFIETDGSMIIDNVREVDATGKDTGKVFVRAKVNIPKKEMIILAAVKKALKGDMKAINFIFDRIDGKAVQPVENTEVNTGGLGFYESFMLSQNGDKITLED